jgi:hypothetical protein
MADADDALRTLLAELEEAHRAFSGERTPAVDEENLERVGVKEAISAVLTYLRAIGVGPRLSAPLHAILAALSDAGSGRSNPLLTPSKYVEGAPKKRNKDILDLSVASAAVTILKDDAKWPLSKAVKRAAEAIGKDPKALGEFRKNIGKGRAPKDAIDNYEYFLKTFRHYNPDLPQDRPDLSPVERAGKLLGIAQDLSAKKG